MKSAATTANAMGVARCPTLWRRDGRAQAPVHLVPDAARARLPADAKAAAASATVDGARAPQTSWMEMVSSDVTCRFLLEISSPPSSRQHHSPKILPVSVLKITEEETLK